MFFFLKKTNFNRGYYHLKFTSSIFNTCIANIYIMALEEWKYESLKNVMNKKKKHYAIHYHYKQMLCFKRRQYGYEM